MHLFYTAKCIIREKSLAYKPNLKSRLMMQLFTANNCDIEAAFDRIQPPCGLLLLPCMSLSDKRNYKSISKGVLLHDRMQEQVGKVLLDIYFLPIN